MMSALARSASPVDSTDLMSQPAPDFSRTGVNADNRVPLYHQIFLILRSKIFDGEFGPGSYLPGERELGETFNVSRITAVRALNELAAAGLVVRERGRGTRVQIVTTGSVARGPSAGGSETLRPVALDEELVGKHAPKITVHGFSYVMPPPAVQAALKLQPGQTALETVRVSRFNGKPFNHLTSYLPESVARHLSRSDLQKSSMSSLLTRAGFRSALVEERVTATLADIQLAERLEVAVGSPLIKILRTNCDKDGTPIQYFIGHYPPDRYQYVVTMPDGEGQGGESGLHRQHDPA